MKMQTIRWLDKYAGSLILLICSGFNALFPSRKKPPQRIIFLKLIEQGATVLAYSSLKYAIERYGKSNVYFLVFKQNRFILDQLQLLADENIIELRNEGIFYLLADLWPAIKRCRKARIDSSVDMEFFARSTAIIAYLIGTTNRVGLYRFNAEQPYRGTIINHRVLYNPYIHIADQYLLLVKALESPDITEPLLKIEKEKIKATHPQLRYEAKDREEVRKKFALPENRRLIIFNCNASDMLPLRRWEMHKFGELSRKVVEQFPDHLILYTGLAEERGKLEKMQRDFELSDTINLAGKTSMRELMILFELADLVLTNDSGPAHFASLFDTRVIVLFGPESPSLYAPRSEKVKVVYNNLACSPCVNVYNHRFSPCTNNLCMQSIRVEEVFSHLKTALNE
jgi:ADP-heptose:LPS heptosyltransferase